MGITVSDIDKILVHDLVENVSDDAKSPEEEAGTESQIKTRIKPKTETEKLLSKNIQEQKAKQKQQEGYIEMIKARALIDYYLQRSRENK